MTNSRIVTGSLWLTCAKLLTTLIGFIATIVLARLLTPEDYGLVALATASNRQRLHRIARYGCAYPDQAADPPGFQLGLHP